MHQVACKLALNFPALSGVATRKNLWPGLKDAASNCLPALQAVKVSPAGWERSREIKRSTEGSEGSRRFSDTAFPGETSQRHGKPLIRLIAPVSSFSQILDHPPFVSLGQFSTLDFPRYVIETERVLRGKLSFLFFGMMEDW